MEFRQLEVFACVAEYKSFSKAAQALYLAQSTVSTHIKNLERELQKELFSRTTKKLRLTDDGRRFLTYVQRILETRDAALEELNSAEEQLLRLGASTIPSGYLLPRLLSSFHMLHPEVYYQIRQGNSEEILERVLDGTIDIGFIGNGQVPSQCVSTPFCKDEMILATPVSDHYLRLHRQGCTLERLLQEPIILREQGSGTQKEADRFLEDMHIDRSKLNVVAEINDLESIKRVIVAGMGVTISSRYVFSDLEAQGQALLYPLPSSVHRSFYIVYLKSRQLRSSHHALVRYILHASI